MLVLMAGLPGTGKSTITRELARRTGGHILDKDVVRQALFAPGRIDYSTEQNDRVVRAMLEAAGYLLEHNPQLYVFLDGRVFSRSYQVEDVIAFAEGVGTPWRILECVCSEQAARRRLAADVEAANHHAENRNFDLYKELKRHFEPITRPKVVLDTDQPIETCVQTAIEGINARVTV